MKSARRTSARVQVPMVEPLEGRQLFAATLPADPMIDAAGTLQVVGTRKSDFLCY